MGGLFINQEKDASVDEVQAGQRGQNLQEMPQDIGKGLLTHGQPHNTAQNSLDVFTGVFHFPYPLFICSLSGSFSSATTKIVCESSAE